MAYLVRLRVRNLTAVSPYLADRWRREMGYWRPIDVIPWDLAQAAHVDASSRFASMLEEELEKRGPMGPRPLQQAPMRVLSGANMPAALVEMAYLTNADQEQGVQSADAQGSLVQAIYDAIVRFRAYLETPPTP